MLPRLRDDQIEIVASPARTKVIAMGRRWGKTFMAGIYALTLADHGGAAAWVVPTYKNARAPWRFAEQMVGPAASIVNVRRSERTIDFPSGGRLSVYSADNDVAMRGESFDLVIVDEAAQIREETYSDVLLPTLADRDGRIMLISTPRGRNWFWREWCRGQEGRPDIKSWTAPTSANPMPSIQSAAALARTRISERSYRQEWLAEFVDDSGGVFRRVSNAITAEWQESALNGHDYVMGVDWGKSHDWTVLTIVDVTTNEICHIDRFNQIDYAVQLGRLEGLYQRFQPYIIIAEQNSIGEPLIEQLKRRGLPVTPFVTSNATKTLAIDSLALAFEQDRIRIPKYDILINELQSFEVTRLSQGTNRYSAPAGLHDDCVMSLAMAWSAINHEQQSLLMWGG